MQISDFISDFKDFSLQNGLPPSDWSSWLAVRNLKSAI